MRADSSVDVQGRRREEEAALWAAGECGELEAVDVEVEEEAEGVGDAGCAVSVRGWGFSSLLLICRGPGEGSGRFAGVVERERDLLLGRDRQQARTVSAELAKAAAAAQCVRTDCT